MGASRTLGRSRIVDYIESERIFFGNFSGLQIVQGSRLFCAHSGSCSVPKARHLFCKRTIALAIYQVTLTTASLKAWRLTERTCFVTHELELSERHLVLLRLSALRTGCRKMVSGPQACHAQVDVNGGDSDGASKALHTAAKIRADRYSTLGLKRTARFFADKAAAFSGSREDVLKHARHFVSSGHDRRALNLLQAHGLHETNSAARLLAAQCLFRLGELDECLAVLGGDDADATALAAGKRRKGRDAIDTGLSGLSIEGEQLEFGNEIRASLCVLRGQVYEKMENANRAVVWYKRALRCDIYCVEAFDAICESGLITKKEVISFVKEVTTDEDEEEDSPDFYAWLVSYYRGSTDGGLPLPSKPSGIEENIDILAVNARRRYDALDFEACTNICRSILKQDPFIDDSILETYLAALVEMDERQELFVTAHSLIDRDPRNGVSWLAVGYYYFACGKPEVARRFLQKATTLNARLASAWVAFGHAFGAQDESDQAMASYRTASRLFPGAQLPMLFMGMEYARQGSLGHASILFKSALDACPSDPAPRHELGVIAYRMGDMPRAVAYFKAALSLWEASDGTRDVATSRGRRAEAEEATLFNLGHCYRRLREFPRARQCYERALGLRPQSPSTCTALGMTLHAMQDLPGAVAMYHRALRHNPEDANCGELLERALCDMFLSKPTQVL